MRCIGGRSGKPVRGGIAVDPWIGPASLRILVIVFRVGRYRWHSVLSLVDCWSRVCSLGADHPPMMKAST